MNILSHEFQDLAPIVLEASFPQPLGNLHDPTFLPKHLKGVLPWEAPEQDALKRAVRDALRQQGFKPTGRNKPASEYLRAAVEAGRLPAINPAVDVCNVVSFHSGFPISVVDLDCLAPPWSIAAGGAGQQYEFNASGQVLQLEGLPCLFDQQGPCANAIKDSQRTKTHAGTLRTLSVIWGLVSLPDHTAQTVAWYQNLLQTWNATTQRLTS